MKRTFLLAAVAAIAGCARDRAAHITTKDLTYLPMHGEEEWHGEVDLGRGLMALADIGVTSKGNGTLSILNLDLGVYDGHNDGKVFDPFLAGITFVDLNADGYRDLVLVTTVVETGEKGDEVLSRTVIGQVYLLDPSVPEFRVCDPGSFGVGAPSTTLQGSPPRSRPGAR